jgi:hypothetical protein
MKGINSKMNPRLKKRLGLPFRRVLVTLFTLAMVLLSHCGGGEITFPQDPTSGADGLGNSLPSISLQSAPSFFLSVQLDQNSQTLFFNWNAPMNPSCAEYRLLLVNDPQTFDPGITQTISLQTIAQGDILEFQGDDDLSQYIQANPNFLSALVLCLTDSNFNDSLVPFPRSNFQNVSLFFFNNFSN